MANNILIVDDSETMRLILKKIVKMSNLSFENIWEAEDGEKALEIWKNNEVSFIFLDINMPEMNGMQFLQNIRTDHKKGIYPKVLIISSEKTNIRVQEAENLGISGFVKKPFDPYSIVEMLNKF